MFSNHQVPLIIAAAKKTATIYSTEPNNKWFENVNVTYESLQKTCKMERQIKYVKLDDIKDKMP